MGWYFLNNYRWKDVIQEITAGWENEKGKASCITHCTRGNVLWSVWEVFIKEENRRSKYIGCDLLHKNSYGWGYKPMDESMHPYYYSCPKRYLEMVPKVECQEWRDEVHKWHERQREKQQKTKNKMTN